MIEITTIQQIAINWKYERFGSFYSTLMKAITLADEQNLIRIEQGFPDHVAAYLYFSRVKGWWERTQEKAVKLGFIK